MFMDEPIIVMILIIIIALICVLSYDLENSFTYTQLDSRLVFK